MRIEGNDAPEHFAQQALGRGLALLERGFAHFLALLDRRFPELLAVFDETGRAELEKAGANPRFQSAEECRRAPAATAGGRSRCARISCCLRTTGLWRVAGELGHHLRAIANERERF